MTAESAAAIAAIRNEMGDIVRGPSRAFESSSSLIRKAALLRFVRNRPAKIDLRVHDLLPSDCQDLGVTESPTVRTRAFIGNEYPVAIGHQVDEVEGLDTFAVGPA